MDSWRFPMKRKRSQATSDGKYWAFPWGELKYSVFCSVPLTDKRILLATVGNEQTARDYVMSGGENYGYGVFREEDVETQEFFVLKPNAVNNKGKRDVN